MATITMQIPDDVQANIENGSHDAGNALRLAAAFSLCQQGLLSTSDAARLAGLSYAEFLEAAAAVRVELFPMEIEEIKEEMSRGITLGCQRVTDNPSRKGGLG